MQHTKNTTKTYFKMQANENQISHSEINYYTTLQHRQNVSFYVHKKWVGHSQVFTFFCLEDFLFPNSTQK